MQCFMGAKHETDAIKAYEEEMKNSHTDFKLSWCGLVINQEYPWIHATPDFLVSCTCCGMGCGEVKCPICIDRSDFDSYVLKKISCLEKVAGNFLLKRNHNSFFKFNNSFLHYQNENIMTLLFVHLIVLTVQPLLKNLP